MKLETKDSQKFQRKDLFELKYKKCRGWKFVHIVLFCLLFLFFSNEVVNQTKTNRTDFFV